MSGLHWPGRCLHHLGRLLPNSSLRGHTDRLITAAHVRLNGADRPENRGSLKTCVVVHCSTDRMTLAFADQPLSSRVSRVHDIIYYIYWCAKRWALWLRLWCIGRLVCPHIMATTTGSWFSFNIAIRRTQRGTAVNRRRTCP
jgi:hypothetical protein